MILDVDDNEAKHILNSLVQKLGFKCIGLYYSSYHLCWKAVAKTKDLEYGAVELFGIDPSNPVQKFKIVKVLTSSHAWKELLKNMLEMSSLGYSIVTPYDRKTVLKKSTCLEQLLVENDLRHV